MKKEKVIKKIRKHLLKIWKIYQSYLDKEFCTEEVKEKGYLSLCIFKEYIEFNNQSEMPEDLQIDYYEFLKGNKW